MKANEPSQSSEKAARGKRLGQPSPKTALARGEPVGVAFLVDALMQIRDEIGKSSNTYKGTLTNIYRISNRAIFHVVNARLIDAAPDLYEALEALADRCMGQDWTDLAPEIRRARAALAKARGEKPESTSTAADAG